MNFNYLNIFNENLAHFIHWLTNFFVPPTTFLAGLRIVAIVAINSICDSSGRSFVRHEIFRSAVSNKRVSNKAISTSLRVSWSAVSAVTSNKKRLELRKLSTESHPQVGHGPPAYGGYQSMSPAAALVSRLRCCDICFGSKEHLNWLNSGVTPSLGFSRSG